VLRDWGLDDSSTADLPPGTVRSNILSELSSPGAGEIPFSPSLPDITKRIVFGLGGFGHGI
jgi:hypothetical protein